ncbi:cystathionine gamma-synthase [Planctomycetia bacterium]|nr:cystathionine gamma-synthase [Planctomycetia bacterium]
MSQKHLSDLSHLHFSTQCVHGGVHKDQQYNSVTTPIYPTSTFYWNSLESHSGYDYTRSSNPTRKALEENIAALEGGAGCSATSTGMSAVHCAMALFSPGDHIIAPADLYGGTFRLFERFLKEKGLTFTFVDMTDSNQVRSAFTPQTRAIWIETPSNPLLKVIDIGAVAGLARARGCISICDNTFLSPYLQRPLDFGVDIVVHSTTKYINGHSDVVGGCVVSKSPEHAKQIAWTCNALGLSCSPFDAWLVLRGLKTLSVRMDAQQASALLIARFLEQHPLIEKVYYPGLESHPQHQLARIQQRGPGAMLAFDVRDGRPVAERVCMRTHLFDVAESLGGIESLISFPTTMSHASMTPAARAAAGITEKTVRISVGLEHADDLIADLQQALST